MRHLMLAVLAGTAAFVSPDAGHGLVIAGAPWNTIGTRGKDSGLNTSPNYFGGSLGGSTVLITGPGARHNVVDASVFGIMDPIDVSGETPQQLLAPAATHALHLAAGASDWTAIRPGCAKSQRPAFSEWRNDIGA